MADVHGFDIRTHRMEPLGDDTEVSPVAMRAAGEVLLLIREMRNPQTASADIAAVLERLGGADLAGLQALGQTLAALASQHRTIRAAADRG